MKLSFSKDSFLPLDPLIALVSHYQQLNVVQHMRSIVDRDIYIPPILPCISPDSYFGSDPSQQIRSILESPFLISVASSCAKFAIALNKPLLLILFPTHNKGFLQYYQSKEPCLSTQDFLIFQPSSRFVILRFLHKNHELCASSFASTVSTALTYLET